MGVSADLTKLVIEGQSMHLRRYQAFTLIEVLISVVLMALMGITTIGVVIVSARGGASNAQHARVVDLGEEILEQVIAAPLENVVHGSFLPSGLQIPADTEFHLMSNVHGLTHMAEEPLLNSPEIRFVVSDPSGDHQGVRNLVEVTLRWTDRLTGRVRMKVFNVYRYDDTIVTYPYRPITSE
jgi:pilin/secretion family protein with methylation motif